MGAHRLGAGALVIGALLVGCNGILGISGDYHRVPNGTGGANRGGSGGTNAGGNGNAHAAGGAAAAAGHGVGGSNGGAEGGTTGGGEAGEAGVSATGGTNGGTGGAESGSGGVSATGGTSGRAGGGATGGGGTGGGAMGGTTGGGQTGGRGSGGGGTGGASSGGVSATGGNGGAPGTGGSSGASTGGRASGGSGGSTGGVGGTSGSGGTGGTGGAGGSTGATVNLAQTKQTLDGFGISNIYATAMSDAQADQMFSTSTGIGLSILRIGMDTNGAVIGATTWADIAKAKARGVTTYIATVWSAPANCKSNNSVNDGGHLLSTCTNSWSTTIAAFPAAVKLNAGVDLYGIAPAYEPDFASCGITKPCNGNYPSMLFTAPELVSFVKAVGQKLQLLSPPVKLFAPDTAEWLHVWSNNSVPGSSNPLGGTNYDYGHALYADSTAWGLVDIVATHQKDSLTAELWPSDVPATKPLWMTEAGGFKWWPEAGPSSDIGNGVVVAGWIHDALVNGGASAWLWWWYQALNTDDNEGLLLKNGTVAKRLYTLGNFSKFIRPGYVRVGTAGTVPANVLLSAYRGSDGTVVIVAVNQGSAQVTLPISVTGATAPAALTPWVTSASDNLAFKTAVTLSSGAFSAVLDGQTVTTFVGK